MEAKVHTPKTMVRVSEVPMTVYQPLVARCVLPVIQ